MKKIFFILSLLYIIPVPAYDTDQFKTHAVKTAHIAGKLLWATGMITAGALGTYVAILHPIATVADNAHLKQIHFSTTFTEIHLDGITKSHHMTPINILPAHYMAAVGISALSAYASYKAFKNAYSTLKSIVI